jgi:germination protein M
MRRGVLLAAALPLLLCVLVAGCGKTDDISTTPLALTGQNEGYTTATLFYRDSGGYIVPVARTLWTKLDTASEVVYLQQRNAYNSSALEPLGLTPILHRTLDYDVDVVDGIARVDIAKKTWTPENAREEREMVDCIVNALCALDGIEGVSFMLDGRPALKLTKGTDVSGVQKARPLNVLGEGKAACTLYYLSPQSELILPVTLQYKTRPGLAQALNAMIAPNADYGLQSVFPDGTALKGANVTNGVARLDFSREFSLLCEHPELEARVLVALNSVCRDLGGATQMMITVEGTPYTPTLAFWPEEEAVDTFNVLGEDHDAY